MLGNMEKYNVKWCRLHIASDVGSFVEEAVDQGSEIYAKSRERFRDNVFLHIERLLTSVNEVFTNRCAGIPC